MAKKAVIVLADGFEEIEAVTTIDILRRAGIEVTIAGLANLNVKGSRGINVTADKNIGSVDSDFDAIILPGGMPGAENLAASEKVRALIVQMHKENKVVAAICASPAVVLAPTGVLNGKSSTCYPGMENGFGSNTAYRTGPVVIDGNIITSRGPATALAFALAIVEKLCGKILSDKVAKATLFKE